MAFLVSIGLAAIGLWALIVGGSLIVLLAVRFWWVLAAAGLVVAIAARVPT